MDRCFTHGRTSWRGVQYGPKCIRGLFIAAHTAIGDHLRRASSTGLVMKVRGLGVLLLGSALCSAIPAVAQFDAGLESKLFDLANEERTKAGLSTLKWSNELMRAAHLHAEKMVAERKLTHRAEGEADLMTRIAAARVHFDSVAENIAYADQPEDLHPGWMHSPGHRANILSETSNALGVAVIKTARGYYAVQDFAHATSSYDSEGAAQRFEKSFNALRKEKRRLRVQTSQPASLHAAACSMAAKDLVSVKDVRIGPGFSAAVGYTTSEPDELPEQVKALASEGEVTELQVGSCYRATPQAPGGTYWFVIVY